MTIIYIYHPLIEASETSDTVITPYGQLWDGNAQESPSVLPTVFINMFQSPIIKVLDSSNSFIMGQ